MKNFDLNCFFDAKQESPYDPPCRLFNYATGQYEDLAWMPGDLSPYIPQHREAQLLYFGMVDRGEIPIYAMMRVLEITVGKEVSW